MVQTFRNVFPKVTTARYNAAAWQDPQSGNIFLISRDVKEAGREGEPDKGRLILSELDSSGNVIYDNVIWEPTQGAMLYEDVRSQVQTDGSVNLGLTVVMRDNIGYRPYPGVTTLKGNEWRTEFPAITVIEKFGPGKNITPIDQNKYFFRPDTEDYFHKLLVFSYVNGFAVKIGDLEFPTNLPWAQWRIGTTMSPIWFSENKALMIFHGITIKDNKYIYSLGRALLSHDNRKYSLHAIEQPILTPDDFITPQGNPLVSELHPELRRVVYCCGGVLPKNDPGSLLLYVNVGDTATFEVKLSMEELLRGLVNLT
jgi:hypothetical protein